jgi:hypothetical protein
MVLGQNLAGSSDPVEGFSMGGLQIPKHAAQLLQQAFEAMKEGQASSKAHDGALPQVEKKQISQLEPIDKLSKSNQVEQPESS